MDQAKIGVLIRTLRQERGMTQQRLAGLIGVSDKAVSKWERGLGLPEVALLPGLSRALDVNLESLLGGECAAGEPNGGNMKKLKFYFCPICQNLITAASENAAIACCGKPLEPMTAKKPAEAHKLTIERIETDLFIHSEHEMTKQHSILFAALLTGDTLTFHRLYPEWNMQTRIPARRHGTLLWCCSEHGLFYQYI